MSKPWYEAAFGADYLERYRHRDVDEASHAVRTLLANAAVDADTPVLDLCCGAGRHVVALRGEGYHVVGFDLSADLLNAATELFRERYGCGEASGRNCPCFVRGDKRHLPFVAGSFGLVTHFFTAFGYFESDEENFGVFGEVTRVLRPRGWYLFDFLNAPQVLAEMADSNDGVAVEQFPDGSRVETAKRLTAGQRRVEKDVRVFHGGKLHHQFRESVRLFHPGELRAALAAKGLEPVREWGDYTGGAYHAAGSSRWIVLCRRF
ncbi:MAG: hypothetical protein PWP23_1003 [Candidatus Sumerlaeota bacterium]|nr:hypothetical protein [Candidatus Sumerlaeota bacterium]